ncbi:MAG: Maf-like protein [Prevotella sp.]|uniref:Maf-like protein n=1 Tax=Prevotella sp. TaxID=59823 RepID=UPI002A30965D|nr:Maf-like protein [Prevotella sp.]MDD7319231.1 Maf-like protein [Prevotellaceae bacterium]MDY4020150.1 Maf-like protein [Prevotella sp.]
MKIILASGSPRRKELLSGLEIDFEVRLLPGIDESYPADTPTDKIAECIAHTKSAAYAENIADDELLITADTIVVVDDRILGKPVDADDARSMLRMISGRTHRVITGVCMKTKTRERSFSVTTDVTFKNLSSWEIDHYVDHYKPFDKAGAYGIQEWIGLVGVESISGSYFNVMGLPVQRIYKELSEFQNSR